jgi:aminopeptidase-like protein
VVPETIGTIAYLANREELPPNMKLGLFLEMLGHDDRFSLQHSLPGDSPLDVALELSLRHLGFDFREGGLGEIIGNDEKVLNGPGVGVPSCSLSRSGHTGRGEKPFPEYHTSADTPAIISAERLDEAVEVVMTALDILEANYVPKRRFKGPVFLSRYGLWVDWRKDRPLKRKLDRVMHLLEGDLDLIGIAHRLGLDFFFLKDWLDGFAKHGLIEIIEPGSAPGDRPCAS